MQLVLKGGEREAPPLCLGTRYTDRHAKSSFVMDSGGGRAPLQSPHSNHVMHSGGPSAGGFVAHRFEPLSLHFMQSNNEAKKNTLKHGQHLK